MTYEYIPRWDRPHRIRWTDDGGFCDAGEDCPVCAEMDEDEDEDEGEDEDEDDD